MAEEASSSVVSSGGGGVQEKGGNGRFWRFSEKLSGRGGGYDIFKGFDYDKGIKVSWLVRRSSGNITVERLLEESQQMINITHENVLKCSDYWRVDSSGVVQITELLSGNILDHLRSCHIDYEGNNGSSLHLIKIWVSQLLAALAFLNSQRPRIVLTRLCCDDIFMDFSGSNLKIGGLVTAELLPHTASHDLVSRSLRSQASAFGFCVYRLAQLVLNPSDIILPSYQSVSHVLSSGGSNFFKHPHLNSFIRQSIFPDDSNKDYILSLSSHKFLKPKIFTGPCPMAEPLPFLEGFNEIAEKRISVELTEVGDDRRLLVLKVWDGDRAKTSNQIQNMLEEIEQNTWVMSQDEIDSALA